MALIICPECGRQISDKAVSCPGCGYPMMQSTAEENNSDLNVIADKIHKEYPQSMVVGIRELRKATGLDLKTARDMMYIRYTGKTVKETEAIRKKEHKEKQRQNLEDLRNACETLQNSFGGSKVARCPRCKSTSISYQDKVSIGRAAVGGALAGPAGAVLGGLTGKKGYAVCLNCGKRWKV